MRTRRRVQQFEEDEDEDGEEEEEDDDPYAQFNLKRLHQKTNSPPPSEEVENYVKLGMGGSGLVLVRRFQHFNFASLGHLNCNNTFFSRFLSFPRLIGERYLPPIYGVTEDLPGVSSRQREVSLSSIQTSTGFPTPISEARPLGFLQGPKRLPHCQGA